MEIFKITVGLTAFSFDFTKDIFLFIFLLKRFDEIVVAEFGANVETPVNSQFLIYMIYFHGASIIATQLIMGLYILRNMKTVFHVQNKWKYAFLAFLIPFFPSIIMYKIIHLNAKKRYLISSWRKEHEANGKNQSEQSVAENVEMSPSIKQNEEVESKMIWNEEMESKGGKNEEHKLKGGDNEEKIPKKGENENTDAKNGEYLERNRSHCEYEEKDQRNGVQIWNKCQGIDNEVRRSLDIYSKLRLVEANVESLPQLLLLLTYFGVSNEVEALGLNNDGYFVFLSASFTFAFIIYAIIGAIDIQKKEQLLFLSHKIILGLSYGLQVIGRVSPMVCICLLAILPPFTPLSMNLMNSQTAIALLALPLIGHMLCGLLASKIFVPDLPLFDRVIHVLSGLFVILPFREMNSERQSHKRKEMTVSVIMIVLDILVQLIGIAYYGPWTEEPAIFPDYDGLKLPPQVPLQIIYLVPRLVLGLSPLAFFLGILLLILYYRRLHSFAPLTADQYWCRREHNSANESTVGCRLCSTSILITCHKQDQLDT